LGHAAGHYIDINPDDYRLRVRNDLRAYAAAHPSEAAHTLALVAVLDARFGLDKQRPWPTAQWGNPTSTGRWC
jgi:hypothetical protein